MYQYSANTPEYKYYCLAMVIINGFAPDIIKGYSIKDRPGYEWYKRDTSNGLNDVEQRRKERKAKKECTQ